MILTTKGRYAVTAVVDLAKNASSGPVKLSDIASRQAISNQYLEQIFNKLKNAEIVSSVKGPGGGYKLNNEPSQVFVNDIIKAATDKVKFTGCGNNDEACKKLSTKCQTHYLWKGLERHVGRFLENVSIADICNNNYEIN